LDSERASKTFFERLLAQLNEDFACERDLVIFFRTIGVGVRIKHEGKGKHKGKGNKVSNSGKETKEAAVSRIVIIIALRTKCRPLST
jgi:hypothetical protein